MRKHLKKSGFTQAPVSKKYGAGFTLIETLIYSLLLSFVLIGALGIAYNIIESSDKNSAKLAVEQEGNFILRKIDWALTGADTLSIGVGPEGPTLLINGDYLFGMDGAGHIQLKRGAAGAIALNSDNLSVSNLQFDFLPPEGVKASFTITSNIAGSKEFETTKYLR